MRTTTRLYKEVGVDRDAMRKLVQWQQSPRRKPLVVQGIRQCGKTWLLKEFGRTRFRSTAYVSFDENPEYEEFFAVKDVERIVENLSLVTGVPITGPDSLLILDEIQNCPAALNSLKYFHENRPDLPVAAAGSLLGISLAGSGFPVGQVDFLKMYPLTFGEFLRANGADTLADYAEQVSRLEPVPAAFLNPLDEQLKTYLVTGGMPEPIRAWAEERDLSLVETALSQILRAYELDFAKHAKPTDFPKISLIWASLPSQLSRENKKFLYQSVKPGARAREYEDALQWLIGADLVTKVFRSTAPGLPISAYDDLGAFKIYLADVGLLRRLARLTPSAVLEQDQNLTEFRGAMTENYVLQSLLPQLDGVPRYWSQSNPPYEVDFLVQHENRVLPVEVKSGKAVASRSLTKFSTVFPGQTPLRVRFSAQNLRLDSDVLNIPLSLAHQGNRLISLALAQLHQ
ncbi:MAG: ATP-binding protein [Propionibacteriaceae bacterium]|nr:ATP-binding protein [Propionibacteriaceae bacterium]